MLLESCIVMLTARCENSKFSTNDTLPSNKNMQSDDALGINTRAVMNSFGTILDNLDCDSNTRVHKPLPTSPSNTQHQHCTLTRVA